MVQKDLQTPLTKRPERWKPLGFFLILLRLLKDLKMPNRSKGSDLWSEIIQVRVTPKVKNQIVLTTEKDYWRLNPLVENFDLYFLPIKMSFFSNEEKISFDNHLKKMLN